MVKNIVLQNVRVKENQLVKKKYSLLYTIFKKKKVAFP